MAADLTAKQLKALMVLLQGSTIIEAARVAEVSERTMHNWLKEPVFSKELKRIKNESYQMGVNQFQNALPDVFSGLLKIANNSRIEKNKLAALRTLAHYAIKAKEADVAELLDKLENGMKNNNNEQGVKRFEQGNEDASTKHSESHQVEKSNY